MRFLVAVSGGENELFSVNRSLDTVGVTGSNPVSRTTLKSLKQSGLHSRKDPETGLPQSRENSRFLPFLGVFWLLNGSKWQWFLPRTLGS
jgi:hypothetical protein